MVKVKLRKARSTKQPSSKTVEQSNGDKFYDPNLQGKRQHIMDEYRAGHAKLVENSKAARLIQRNFRSYKSKTSPIKQGIRDARRQARTFEKRFKTDNSYRREVMRRIGSTTGEGLLKGTWSTASKLGTGALAGYIIAMSKEDKNK